MGPIILLISGLLTCLLLFLLYSNFKLRKRTEHLKKQGIPYLDFMLSNFLKFIAGSMDMVTMEKTVYKAASETKAPLVAMSDLGGQINFLIMDLDLVRSICVKDFDHFINRRKIGTEQSNIYTAKMVVFMENENWKGTRAKLSPSFTTGKIRKMLEIFTTSSERMEKYIKQEMGERTSVDLDFLQIFPKYALDVIASCAFGIDSKSFENRGEDKSTFEQMAQKFGFRFNARTLLKFALLMGAPRLAAVLGLDAMDTESQQYFSSVIKSVMKKRRESGERREDFLQLMMDARDGLLKEDEETNQVMNGIGADDDGKNSLLTSDSQKKIFFDDDNIIANGMLFLNAGFDPTQSLLLFTLYALAREPEVQEKLYQEVKSVLGKRGGKLSYEAISDMAYLDMVINESLRQYTPATRTERCCTKDYHVPGTNFVIEKGSIIMIPLYSTHQDPRYFPDPEKFIPERFTPENKATRHPYAFMPFGHGPRNCIGMRFALVKAKAAIASLVHSFKFAPCSKTKFPMQFDRNPNVKPLGDMWLNVEIRED